MRIINIDTPTCMATPTNTNIPKHTQNSYGMCYLHTTNIFHPALLVILFIYLILFKKKKKKKSKTWPLTTYLKKNMGLSFSVKLHLYLTGKALIHYG